jgi:hypothetical protein
VLTAIGELSPHARVATAVLPFLVALALRIVLGRSMLTRVLVSIGTMWFVVNVLMAPYSVRMRQDIHELQTMFRH